MRHLLLAACVLGVAGYPTRAPLFASTPVENRRELKPQAEMGTFFPLMMYMGRRRKSRGGGGVFDPKQCAATCAAQQGFCPEGRRLMQARPAAPVVPDAPSPALGPQGYNVGVCAPASPAEPPARAQHARARVCRRPSR